MPSALDRLEYQIELHVKCALNYKGAHATELYRFQKEVLRGVWPVGDGRDFLTTPEKFFETLRFAAGDSEPPIERAVAFATPGYVRRVAPRP